MNREQDGKKTTLAKKSVKKPIEEISVSKYYDIDGTFIHIKVGTKEDPASDEQIGNIEKQIVNLFNKNNVNCLAFVTHHAVSIDIVKREPLNDGV